MTGLSRILLVVLVVAIAGLGAFLATWDIPAPVSPIEKVLPNDQFPR